MIDLVLVDKDFLLLQALENAFEKEPYIRSVSIYQSGSLFLKDIQKYSESLLVISEITTFDISGLSLIELLKKQNAGSKMIILSGHFEVATVKYAMKLGVDGYLSKTSAITELFTAIEAVMRGESYISTNLREVLVNAILLEDKITFKLSVRELEVLQHVCSGRTIKESASMMGLSRNTVQSYYKSVLKKLNQKRTQDLIVFAIQNGLFNFEKK